MIAGVAWSSQLLSFLIMLAFGLAGGICALLYKRKARTPERFLTDFAATTAIGALFFLGIETGCDGQLRAFAFLAFALGIFTVYKLIPAAFSKLKKPQKRVKSGNSGLNARKG